MQQAPPIDPHFSILVAGHRPHRLPTDAGALHAIESAIDRLVAHIAAQFAELADCEQLYGAQAPRRCVTRIIGASSVTINLRGETALAFCDLLMVVWDGHDPRGPAGGTVRLLREAALCSKPVIWIDLAGTARHFAHRRTDPVFARRR